VTAPQKAADPAQYTDRFSKNPGSGISSILGALSCLLTSSKRLHFSSSLRLKIPVTVTSSLHAAMYQTFFKNKPLPCLIQFFLFNHRKNKCVSGQLFICPEQ
jgi:hypothetical protein